MSKDKADECVKVVLRCRPMNSTEKQAGRERIVEMNTSSGQIRLQNPAVSEPPKEYTFDGVYNWDSRQVDVYDGTCKPIVTQVLQGFNGTVFAYGQTGTGKTFSMEGVAGDEDLKGIIPRCFEHIFDEIGAIDEKEFREAPDPLPNRCTMHPNRACRCRNSGARVVPRAVQRADQRPAQPGLDQPPTARARADWRLRREPTAGKHLTLTLTLTLILTLTLTLTLALALALALSRSTASRWPTR